MWNVARRGRGMPAGPRYPPRSIQAFAHGRSVVCAKELGDMIPRSRRPRDIDDAIRTPSRGHTHSMPRSMSS